MMDDKWIINCKLFGSGRGLILSYYHGISLEGLGKVTKTSVVIASLRVEI
jgi:hypothetical protein